MNSHGNWMTFSKWPFFFLLIWRTHLKKISQEDKRERITKVIIRVKWFPQDCFSTRLTKHEYVNHILIDIYFIEVGWKAQFPIKCYTQYWRLFSVVSSCCLVTAIEGVRKKYSIQEIGRGTENKTHKHLYLPCITSSESLLISYRRIASHSSICDARVHGSLSSSTHFIVNTWKKNAHEQTYKHSSKSVIYRLQFPAFSNETKIV